MGRDAPSARAESSMPKKKNAAIKMRIRVYAGNRMLGPGKIQLLKTIGDTGSLSAAAKELGMSYMRAWNLSQELNRDPNQPMIEMSRGGPSGGSASLTSLGKKILRLYQEMDRAAGKAARANGLKLAQLLK
jgi:molybdate transport system regulatory protein